MRSVCIEHKYLVKPETAIPFFFSFLIYFFLICFFLFSFLSIYPSANGVCFSYAAVSCCCSAAADHISSIEKAREMGNERGQNKSKGKQKQNKKVNSQTRKPLPPPSSTRAKVKTRETREPEKRAAHLYTVYIYCIRDDNRQKRSDSFCQTEFFSILFLFLRTVCWPPSRLDPLLFSYFPFFIFYYFFRTRDFS